MNNQASVCSQPPALSDEDLFAVVNDIASDIVLAHLNICQHCAYKLSVARIFVKRLSSYVYRFGCPDVENLAAYVAKTLDRNSTADIERHILDCVRCSDELLVLYEANKVSVASSPTIASTIDGVVVRLGQSVRRKLAALAPTTPGLVLRGTEQAHRFTATAGATQVLIETQQRTAKWILSGQIAVDEEESWAGGLVEVYSDKQVLLTGFIDEMNEFHFEGLQTELADLLLTSPSGSQIVINSIPLRF